ncbi:hypothetical protein CR513_24337, partial [Mucuna pruriens]
MTKRDNRESSNYKNLMNSAWKHMRTPGSTSKRLKLIAGKLRSRWDGPFAITNTFPNGAVQLKDEHRNSTFQVNGHQIQPFYQGSAPIEGDMEIISLMEPAPPDGTT